MSALKIKGVRVKSINDIQGFLVAGSLSVMMKFRASWAIPTECREVIAGYSWGDVVGGGK